MALDTDKIDEAVLALLYLTRHDHWRAWKGFDWRWCKIAALGLGSAPVGHIGPLPRSPDDRCPTRPMNRAGTRSRGRATRSATGQSTTEHCSSAAVLRSG